MKKITILGCALLLVLTGCSLGDRAPARRTVSLTFPSSAGQSKVVLSTNDMQVQEALKLIDNVLTSGGYVRDTNPPSANSQGFVASYALYNGTGPRPIGGPSIYLEKDRLEVVVVDGGDLNSPLSSATKKICASLQKELSSRYGSERVKVED